MFSQSSCKFKLLALRRLRLLLPARPANAPMASLHPRSRSFTPPGSGPPPEKRQRLDTELHPAEQITLQGAPASDHAPSTSADAAAPKSKKNAKSKNKNKKNARRAPEPFSSEDILTREVIALLGQEYVDSTAAQNLDWDAPFEQSTQLELTVSRISPSTGQS